MSWIDAPGVERRPLVIVEDHLYHASEMIAAIAAARPALVGHLTVCAIDRAGPDTDAVVRDWLSAHPALQVAAAIRPQELAPADRDRVVAIEPRDLADVGSFGKLVA